MSNKFKEIDKKNCTSYFFDEWSILLFITLDT